MMVIFRKLLRFTERGVVKTRGVVNGVVVNICEGGSISTKIRKKLSLRFTVGHPEILPIFTLTIISLIVRNNK